MCTVVCVCLAGVGWGVGKTVLCLLKNSCFVSVFTLHPIWPWVQVPSNVPFTTTDLAALVPEVSAFHH